MTQWHFVVAAYAVALFATGALILSSARVMRRAEADVDELKRP